MNDNIHVISFPTTTMVDVYSHTLTHRARDGTKHHPVEIPRLGFGVWQIPDGGECRDIVLQAFEVGYRHIDTAQIYGNESDVGEAIAQSGLNRSEIFVTTKLWRTEGLDAEHSRKMCEQSIARLGLDCVDLFLVHAPTKPIEKRHEVWEVMEGLLHDGLTRSIGVSNFARKHLVSLAAKANLLPCTNQIELHPFASQEAVVSASLEHGALPTAYSPLQRALSLDHTIICAQASRMGCTPAQLLIAWGLQHGWISIPKTANPERLIENLAAHDLQLDAEALTSLDTLEEGGFTGTDPETRE